MRALYHRDAYDVDREVRSYWRRTAGPDVAGCEPVQAETDVEIAIIGAGYTGLSAALHLAREASVNAIVLDAGEVGWGASSRNGGFCCLGSHKLGNTEQIRRFGLETTQAFFRTQQEAIALVRSLSETEGFEIDAAGTGETLVAHRPDRMKQLAEEREFLARIFGVQATLFSKDGLAAFGMQSPVIHGGLHIPVGFGLHPAKLVRGLAQAAIEAGARVAPHSPVTGWTTSGGRHHLLTPNGTVHARKVLIATNGYTRDDLHRKLSGRTLPALANVLVTRPLTDSELAAQGWTTHEMAVDTRNLLHWYRLLPDKRIVFGGRGGFSANRDGEAQRKAALVENFQTVFPAWRDVEIDSFWSGLVCLAIDRMPHVGETERDSGVFHALAYHGNGVAMGTWSGRAAARLMTKGKEAAALPAIMSRPLRPFPFPQLRLLYLRCAYAYFGLRDALP